MKSRIKTSGKKFDYEAVRLLLSLSTNEFFLQAITQPIAWRAIETSRKLWKRGDPYKATSCVTNDK